MRGLGLDLKRPPKFMMQPEGFAALKPLGEFRELCSPECLDFIYFR